MEVGEEAQGKVQTQTPPGAGTDGIQEQLLIPPEAARGARGAAALCSV